MTDFSRARLNMVNAQLLTNGIHNEALIDIYAQLPREMLADEAQRPFVYLDEDLPVGKDRWMLEPMIEARMLQEAVRVPMTKDGQAALVLGAASLPAVAILTRFVPTVIVVEPDADMCRRTHDLLSARDGARVTIINAPYTDGHLAKAPYDLIFVPGAVARIPSRLTDQLSTENGRLVCVLRETPRAQGRIVTLRRMPEGGTDMLVHADAATPYLAGFEPAVEFVF